MNCSWHSWKRTYLYTYSLRRCGTYCARIYIFVLMKKLWPSNKVCCLPGPGVTKATGNNKSTNATQKWSRTVKWPTVRPAIVVVVFFCHLCCRCCSPCLVVESRLLAGDLVDSWELTPLCASCLRCEFILLLLLLLVLLFWPLPVPFCCCHYLLSWAGYCHCYSFSCSCSCSGASSEAASAALIISHS